MTLTVRDADGPDLPAITAQTVQRRPSCERAAKVIETVQLPEMGATSRGADRGSR